MIDAIPYAVLLVGPFLLAFLVGKKALGASYGAFGVGLLTFTVASILCAVAATPLLIANQKLLGGSTLSVFLGSVIVGGTAGLFEESSRFYAFRIFKGLRQRRDWNTGIMFAIGHSGMEAVVVAAIMLTLVAIVTYGGDVLPPEVVEKVRPMLSVGLGQNLYMAFERLFVGLLIHSCFTSVVVLGLIRGQKRYLLGAMAWHCVHDMIGINLQHVFPHWIAGKLWVLTIVVVYTWLLFRLRRVMQQAAATPEQAKPTAPDAESHVPPVAELE